MTVKTTMAERIEMARAAVVAKAAYWDALGALEKATAANGGWDDFVSNKVGDRIENLAVDAKVVSDTDILIALGFVLIEGV